MRRSPCHAVAASFDQAIEFSGAGEEKANRIFPQDLPVEKKVSLKACRKTVASLGLDDQDVSASRDPFRLDSSQVASLRS